MKKINVVFKNTSDAEFVNRFLEKEGADFEVFDISKFRDSGTFSDDIKRNDLGKLQEEGFDAQLFQSVDENVPTRLLIPGSFSEKEDWDKEYTLYHELGHYFSIENDLIREYNAFLEECNIPANLLTQLIRIPFEVEAEKYVFENHQELFNKHANEVYLDYSNQVRDQIRLIDENSIKDVGNFSVVYEIRVYRYNCVIENTYDHQSENYARHKENVDAIKKELSRKGHIFIELNKEADLLNDALQESFYKDGDFGVYMNKCKEIYEKARE